MSDSYLTITVFRDERELAKSLADRLAADLARQPRQVLGLATGRTPVRLYHELGTLRAKGRADFSHVVTFNLDEFWGVSPRDPGSYRAFMDEHLFRRVEIRPEQINFLRGDAPDADQECARYDAAIASAGGIDIQLLGIGTNGHIGFNEPARELAARTHRVRLKESTRRSNAALFDGDVSRVPAEALSMGMGSILRARHIVLIATGKSKARCVQQLVNGPITTKLPASFLQLHASVEIFLDTAAAAGIAS
jgi:glucosamine-6-phosphate deaminase